MVDFSKNLRRDSIAPARPQAAAAYSIPSAVKFKRVAMACFLCGMAACILVSLIGLIFLFIGFQTSAVLGRDMSLLFENHAVFQGLGFATLMSAMNWYFAYFTVPVATVALAFSIGRFPRRGIVRAAPYYRWASIWGAVLVSTTTGLASFFLSDQDLVPALSGWVCGGVIGGVAGLICGAIFRGIVRPAEQVKRIQIDVF